MTPFISHGIRGAVLHTIMEEPDWSWLKKKIRSNEVMYTDYIYYPHCGFAVPVTRGPDGRFAKPEQARRKGAGAKKSKPKGNKKQMPPAELRGKKAGLKKRAGAKG